MLNTKRFRIENIGQEPWAPTFLREMDLVIAANLQRAITNNATLYNAELNARVAHHCSPLDSGYTPRFLGVRKLPDNSLKEGFANLTTALTELPKEHRGSWQVIEVAGRYDAFMSDGYGGIATTDGEMFMYSRPDVFTAEELYGSIASWLVYKRRQEIRDEILQHSYSQSTILPGATLRDVWVLVRNYSKIVFDGPAANRSTEDPEAPLVRMTRPGVKVEEKVLDRPTFLRLFNQPILLPERYQDPRNGDRLYTLRERRAEAARAAWAGQFEEEPVQGLNEKLGVFRANGDALRRGIFLEGDTWADHSGAFEVRFAPNSDQIIGTETTWIRPPAVLRTP